MEGSKKKLLDFTVPNIWMEEPYFTQFWGSVAEEFDLKFITIVRDPVRRHYSEFIGQYFNGWEKLSSGKNDLNKTLDLKDFIGISFTTGPDGDLYQLPDQQFANLYWFRKDWFDRADIKKGFKAK